MRVVVGLGNPGAKYVGTRHNIGFEVVDYLAAAPSVGPFRKDFQALVAEANENGEKLLFVKPETFMNLSGRTVRAIVDFYKLPFEHLMVISDDFNLPLGKIRVRGKGSHGGQNGLRNIQEQLATDEYARMRIGVGQPGPGEAVDFVLSKFKQAERPAVDDAVSKAAQAILLWVRAGLPACMNLANAGEQPEKKPKPPKRNDQPPMKADNAEQTKKQG